MSLQEALSHAKGIDYKYPVQRTTIPQGTVLTQFQLPDTNMGRYFTPQKFATARDQLGIYTGGRKPRAYIAIREAKALKSTTAPISDNWSIPGLRIETKGGAIQYFCPNSSHCFVDRYRFRPSITKKYSKLNTKSKRYK